MLLMIDNYASFTFNLVQYFCELGEEVKVVRNDEITLDQIAALKPDRLEALMGRGGVHDCGKAGNCAEVCPKQIPLLESIAAVQRQATVYSIKKFFSR